MKNPFHKSVCCAAQPLMALTMALMTALPILLCSATHADVNARLGSSGPSGTPSQALFDAFDDAGVKIYRIGMTPKDYWDRTNKKPLTAAADAKVQLVRQNGLTPILLFNYYADEHSDELPVSEVGNYNMWKAIGSAYATKFRSQGVRHYTAFNEPMGHWNDTNGDGTPDLPTQSYYNALKGLADGVHSVDSTLVVSPHGYRQDYIFNSTPTNKRNIYLAKVVPLFNDGTLGLLNIHRYVGPTTSLEAAYNGSNTALAGSNKYSVQTQFDEAKRIYGITRNIRHGTSELNVNAEHSFEVYTDAQAKNYFLTILWSSLGVVGSDGKPANDFSLLFSLHLQPGASGSSVQQTYLSYGLSKSFSPWVPTPRGAVLQQVTQLARGLDFASSDPRKSGVAVLTGTGKKMWVWHNRQYWSNLWKSGSSSSFTVTGIPTSATRLEVYNENGHLTGVSRSLSNQSSVTLTGLPNNCTLMFVANASGSAGTPVDYGSRQLVNRYSGKVLEIESYSTADGVNARQWSSVSGNKKQVWRFQYQSDGYYRLFNDYSGKALALDTSSGTAPGANVFQYNTSADDNRLWKVEPVGNGYYRLINKLSGHALALDLNSATNGGYAATANGANVFQYSYTGNLDNKQWRFDVPPSSANSTTSTAPSGATG